MKRILLIHPASRLLPLLIGLWLAGCDSARSNGPVNRDLPTISMPIGSKTFTLEVADKDATREVGLMNRDSMPADHGMLFVFASDEPREFWMKNTHIPLDIIFADHSGHVVSIGQMKPYDLNTTASDGPAKFAIELNAGAAGPTGIKAGDVLKIPGDAGK